MTVAQDTFAEFVTHLAEALDDHDCTGEGWAARMHFSRQHFDRIVRSVGGEPPETFRRRVLLERAAYRMLTTHSPLIDIAVETGYGSHEAFTRAFSRAYGRPPAEWRKAPQHIQIPAPSGVHFHPPAGLRLPARDQVTAMDLLTRMVEHHIWLTGEMISAAGELPDEALDELIVLDVDDDQQTIRSLLSRLVGQMGMWNAAMENRDYDWSVEDHEAIPAMRQRLAVEGRRTSDGSARLSTTNVSTTPSSTRCAIRPRFSRTAGWWRTCSLSPPTGAPSWRWPSTSTASTGSAGATRCSGWPNSPERGQRDPGTARGTAAPGSLKRER